MTLVLAVVASTLVQLPRSFVDLPRNEVKDLVLRCHNRIKDYLARDFDTITVTRSESSPENVVIILRADAIAIIIYLSL